MQVHGQNIVQKENHKTKYLDKESKQYLSEIRKQYDAWKNQNERIKGPRRKKSSTDDDLILSRVELFSHYKDFLDQQKYAEKFDSRSNLHSSVLEEFIYFLFRDLVSEFSSSALIGKSRTFKDIFFVSDNYENLVSRPEARVETKDHDFVIGTNIETKMNASGSEIIRELTLQIPAVAVECKTYLDKTMLEGASTAAEQLKMKNPNAIYVVVAEWLKLTENVNLKKFKVDQIYVLRKQRNTDREFRYLAQYEKNPIYPDVVSHFYNLVRTHLTENWNSGVSYGLQRGYLM